MLIAGNTPEENFRTLHAAGCIQTFADLYTNVDEAMKIGYPRFCKLMYLTQMRLCDGCPVLRDEGTCEAYNQYNTFQASKHVSNEARIKAATTPNNGPFGSMSVKQIAKKCGTSISQVRRLKVQDRLDTLLEKKSCS